MVLLCLCVAACTTAPHPAPAPEPAQTDAYPEYHRLYAGGVNFLNKGDFPNAIRVLEQVWVRDPAYREVASSLARAYLFAGLEYYAEGRYPLAIEMWENVLSVNPGHAKARRYIARARDERRRLDDAARK